jgi:foldase protein PrsA
MSRLVALGAFFVVAVAVAACGSGVPGNSVADVAGNPISTQAFDHWMYVAAKSQASGNPGAPVIVPTDPPKFTKCVAQVRAQVPQLAKEPDKTIQSQCKQLFTSLSGTVLDFLIKGYWYQEEALRDHVKVTDAQVNNAFKSAEKAQFPTNTTASFNQFLSQTGQTLQDVLFRFRISQVFQKLLAKQSHKVTPAQISAYYKSHLKQYGTPETRDLRIVLTKSKSQADAARAALKHGQSWKKVAKKYSIDPTSKNNGGLLVGVQKGQEDHALDVAAFSASANKLLGPVKGQFGYYVFEVTKITKATQQTLAQATASITSTLTQQNSTTSQTALDSLVKKHWQSQTTCQSEFVAIEVDCSNYKAAPTPTTPTVPTTPPAPSTTPTATTTSTTPATTTSGTTTKK